MIRAPSLKLAICLFLPFIVSACAGRTTTDVMSSKPAAELRSMQSRSFDTSDTQKTMKTVISTLQDVGYTIDKVDAKAGTVSATKLSMLRLSASVFSHGTTQTTVRANAIVMTMRGAATTNTQVDDPEFYQKCFFDPLAQSMFLTALSDND